METLEKQLERSINRTIESFFDEKITWLKEYMTRVSRSLDYGKNVQMQYREIEESLKEIKKLFVTNEYHVTDENRKQMYNDSIINLQKTKTRLEEKIRETDYGDERVETSIDLSIDHVRRINDSLIKIFKTCRNRLPFNDIESEINELFARAMFIIRSLSKRTNAMRNSQNERFEIEREKTYYMYKHFNNI